MAVLAPMPSASVSTATAVKPGFFSNWRKANLRSFINQFRNPKTEIRKKPKARMPKGALAGLLFWFSKFGIRISLGIRISVFVFSFVSQRLHGIDLRRAPRGYPTRQHRNGHE